MMFLFHGMGPIVTDLPKKLATVLGE